MYISRFYSHFCLDLNKKKLFVKDDDANYRTAIIISSLYNAKKPNDTRFLAIVQTFLKLLGAKAPTVVRSSAPVTRSVRVITKFSEDLLNSTRSLSNMAKYSPDLMLKLVTTKCMCTIMCH